MAVYSARSLTSEVCSLTVSCLVLLDRYSVCVCRWVCGCVCGVCGCVCGGVDVFSRSA